MSSFLHGFPGDLITINQELTVINLNDDLIQLVHRLIHAKTMIKKSLARGKRVLHYAEVIVRVNPATKYLADDSDFRTILETRNGDFCQKKLKQKICKFDVKKRGLSRTASTGP